MKRPAQFGDEPAGYAGIAWGIRRMKKLGKPITPESLHAFLGERDLRYGLEYIRLILSEPERLKGY